MSSKVPYEDFISNEKDSFRQQLFEVLRIPSISASAGSKGDVRRAAEWFFNKFKSIGLAAEIIETSGHPLVYAETPAAGNAPVLLIYGHYDVQPPDPLELWETPPFEPSVRNGNVYARGATDDKGQFLTHIFAAESHLKTAGTLPFQIKFIVEGEEEIGGSGISAFLNSEEGKKKLACDCLLISDTSMFGPGQPTITYGLRGVICFELFLTGPKRDLHSGTFGGSVFNPAAALCKILARLTDENGIVQVPHFYDDVLPLTERESQQFSSLSFDEKLFFAKIGLEKGFGEAGYSANERRWTRPSFDINGITAGYQGEGSKTIIPCKASAKFSFRIVPNQMPEKIIEDTRRFIASLIPEGITSNLITEHAAPGMCLNLDGSKFVEPMSAALEKTFSCPPVFIREGGSIPIAADFSRILKADVLLVGWGQDDDALHSPNEKFSLASFNAGILASARFIAELAERYK